MQDLLPLRGLYIPAGHNAQDLLPLKGLYFPGRHGEQAWLPLTGAYVPGLHKVQDCAGCAPGLKDPASQATHDDAPKKQLKWPEGQRAQGNPEPSEVLVKHPKGQIENKSTSKATLTLLSPAQRISDRLRQLRAQQPFNSNTILSPYIHHNTQHAATSIAGVRHQTSTAREYRQSLIRQ
jgi:hypothetical protein